MISHSDAASDQQLWEPLLVAPIAGAPEIVIPGLYCYLDIAESLTKKNTLAGTIQYQSRISGRQEPLPVCVSIMGLPGKTSAFHGQQA